MHNYKLSDLTVGDLKRWLEQFDDDDPTWALSEDETNLFVVEDKNGNHQTIKAGVYPLQM